MCKETQDSDLIEIIKDLSDKVVYEIEDGDETSLDDVGYLLYQSYLIMESINPRLTREVNFLSALVLLLEEWEEEIEFVNKALGLPPEA